MRRAAGRRHPPPSVGVSARQPQRPVSTMERVLEELARVLESRKGADAKDSYVAGLYEKGVDAILKKIGEEATEVVLAAKGDNDAALLHEAADLWFHVLVLLAHRGLGPEQVLSELDRRFGKSGLEEKAGRDRQ